MAKGLNIMITEVITKLLQTLLADQSGKEVSICLTES